MSTLKETANLEQFTDFLDKRLTTPPRPGLTFDERKHRWVKREGEGGKALKKVVIPSGAQEQISKLNYPHNFMVTKELKAHYAKLGFSEGAQDKLFNLNWLLGQNPPQERAAENSIMVELKDNPDGELARIIKAQINLETACYKQWLSFSKVRELKAANEVKEWWDLGAREFDDTYYDKMEDAIEDAIFWVRKANNLWRKGKHGLPMESWTSHAEGSEERGYTHEKLFLELEKEGYRVYAGVATYIGAPEEGEIKLIRLDDNEVILKKAPIQDKDLHITFFRRDSILLQYVGYNILINCTGDFQEQVTDLGLGRIDVILFSDVSNDSVEGVRQLIDWLSSHNQNSVACWMAEEAESQLLEDLGELEKLTIRHLRSGEELEIFGLKVIPFQIDESKQSCWAFRIGDALVYLKEMDYAVAEAKVDLFNGVNTIILGGVSVN